MVGVGFSVTGAIKVAKVLRKINTKVQNEASKRIHNAGLFLEGEIKESISGHRAEPTSVDTGNFLSSVKTNNQIKFGSIVFTNVKYAKVLEFGSTKKGNRLARSHFRNSLERNSKKIKQIISKGIKVALR